MYLTYCDHLGQLIVLVNGSIDFCDGFAYFDVGDKTMKIPIDSIISIYPT